MNDWFKYLNSEEYQPFKNKSTAFSKATRSSKSSEYITPRSLFDKLNSIFEFKIDPCTTKDNPLGVKIYYTKDDIPDNGISAPWRFNTFINPPFGNGIKSWLLKMHEESIIYPKNQYVMLLPARTETKWFQDLIYGKYYRDSFIYFLKGRFKFTNPEYNYKNQVLVIGNMLWIKNATTHQKLRLMHDIKGIYWNIHQLGDDFIRTES